MDPDLFAAVRRLAVPEDEILAAIRSRAASSVAAPDAEVGALLRLLTSLRDVRHAVEIGAGGGVSGAYLVAAMAGGMLTSVEGDAHLHGLATAAYNDLGITDRVRAILGDPATVAGRLSDAQYDLVLVQHDPEGVFDVLPVAARLLRPGGLLVVRRICAGRDVAPADVLRALTDAPWTATTVLDVDDGLVLTRRAP